LGVSANKVRVLSLGTWRPGAGRLGAGGCGFRRLRFPAAAVSGGSPRTRFPLLFRTRNPTRNATVPASPQLPVIMKP